MDEMTMQPAGSAAEAETAAAPAEEKPTQPGDMPRKKKKKRPAGSAAAGEQSSKPAVDASAQPGDVPRKKKKKRPADGAAAAEHRIKTAGDASAQSGDVPRRKKKKRPADSTAAAEHRSKPAEKMYRTQPQRTVREAAAVRRPERQHPALNVRAAAELLQRRSKEAASEAVRSIRPVSTGIFVIGVVLYIIVVSLIIRSINKKANRYLSEYESARPQYTIESYVAELGDSFISDMMTQAAAGLNFTDFEKPEMLYDSVRSQAASAGTFTYQSAEDFTDSRPDYYILHNGEAIAKVALSRVGWTERFKFPVWRAEDPVSVIQLHASPAYTLSVTMPENSTLRINGVEVPFEQYMEVESDFQLSDTERFFMEQPMAQKYVLSGLYCPPQVSVTDADGNVLEPYSVPDADHAEQNYIFPIADKKNPDSALTDRVTALTYAYMDYVINTRCELDANLANLSNYMLAGSPVYNLMYTIASDIWYNNDPNMREDHVFEITHVKQYADNVCTVDVHLESTIGKVAVNDYVGTVRWVMVNNGYDWYATNLSLHP